EQINLNAFKDYAEAVYSLNVPFMVYNLDQLFNQMHIYNDHNDRNDSNPSISLQLSPNFKYYIMQCFKKMDTDNDGFITVEDVERILLPECNSKRLFKEAHFLHS
ncbi:hypothetical protein LOAG_14546, partial [Loa loa]